MISKEKTLEKSGFLFKGESFVHPEYPIKFGISELDKMDDALFLETMKEVGKKHKITIEFVNKEVAPVKEQKQEVKKTVSPETKPEKKPETKPSEDKTLPAIPKVLLDAGMKNVLLAPRQAFVSAGGTEQEFAREINYAVQALLNNDYLLACAKKEPAHFIEAIKNVGLSGLTLSPELKLGYLIPRKGKIYFNSSYMGKCEIIMRGGSVLKVYAKLVFEGEKFEVHEGTESKIIHIPDPWGEQTMEKLKGGYGVAKLANGETLFGIMPKARIEEIRNMYSEGYEAKKGFTPWEKDGDALEMARKTVVNWFYKFVPKTGLSEHQIKVLEVTGEFDRDVMDDHLKSAEKEKAERFANDGPADGGITDAQIVG